MRAILDIILIALNLYIWMLIASAILSWLIYSFALFARRGMGWTGRRAAWLSAFAFVLVLLNLVPVGYFLTRSHNF